jgi:putative ABC transport system permease protein
MLDDLRYSVRVLRRHATLTMAVVCTLALTTGVNTAVFSVVDRVLVRPLPIDAPDRVAVIWPRERANPATIGEVSYATFRSWQGELRSFGSLAAMGSANWSLILHEGDPVTLPVAAVSASFFRLLGTSAAIGRTFVPEDEIGGVARVAVISHASWTARFAADPGIIGRRLRFKDAVYTIVGVMPQEFDYPRGVELWVPLVPQLVDASAKWETDVVGDPAFGVLFLLGRLSNGVSFETAQREVSALITRDAGSGFRPGMEAALTPIDEHIFGATRPALIALAVCVAFVLLIGCANVAVLLLARAAARAHETAVRVAMGASRLRIARQSLSDAFVLAALGTAAGLLLAYWGVNALVAMAPDNVPRLDAVQFDVRVFGFAVIVCVCTTLLVGLGPGLQASRWTLGRVLNHDGARLGRSNRLRHAFVVAQVGLALVLLVSAGLVGRSFANMLRLDIGFDPVNVLTLDVSVPDATSVRHNQFYTALLARLTAMPGVESAGAVFQRPLEHAGIGMDAPILIEGQRVGLAFRDWERNPTVNFESVTPDYFRAIGTRVLRGRAFTSRDDDRAPRVAIVSDRLARRLWPGQDPIGRRIHAPGVVTASDVAVHERWPLVVGVVEDARYRGLSDPRFDLYVPYLQHSELLVKHLMVRTRQEPLAVVNAIRHNARTLESTALIENVRTMDGIVGDAMAPWRFSASTLGLLGILALALASLGVYAIVNQSVVERTREIGVRVAVGARPRQIATLVMRDGLRLTMVGIAIGLAAAVFASRVLTTLLYNVQPRDPMTLIGMALLFACVSTAAMLVPMWRAIRVDAIAALKRE